MKIKKLNLFSFGKFNKKYFDLSPGLNLFYGKNESGKSTISTFIRGMFYGFAKEGKRRVFEDFSEKYKPWGKEEYRGSIEMNIDGDILIERDFSSKSSDVLIRDLQTGEDITDSFNLYESSSVAQPGVAFFSMSKAMFENGLFISSDMPVKSNIANELRSRMDNYICSRDESVDLDSILAEIISQQKALGNIEKKTGEYGKIYREYEEILNLENSLKEGTERENILYRRRNDLEEKLKNLELNISEISKINIQKKKDRIAEIYGELSKNTEYTPVKIGEYEEAVRLNTSLKEIYSKLDEISEKEEFYFVDEEIIEDYESIEEIKAKYERSKRGRIPGFILLILIVGINCLFLFKNMYRYMTISMPLLFLFLFITIFRLVRGSEIKKELKKELRKLSILYKIDEIENFLETNGKRELEKKNRNENLGFIDKGLDKEILLKTADEYENRLESIFKSYGVENMAQMSGLMESMSLIQEEKSRRKFLEKELEQILEEVEESEKGIFSKESRSLEEKYQNIKLEISKISGELNSKESAVEKLRITKAQLDKKKEILEKIRRQREVVDISESILLGILKENHKNLSPKLNERISEIFEKITGGKYSEVKADSDLNLHVYDRGASMFIHNLSRGTVQQLYFAFRYAILDYFEDVPIFIDDHFVDYDLERLHYILDFLYEESKKRQIIIFSHDERERNYFNSRKFEYNLINLES